MTRNLDNNDFDEKVNSSFLPSQLLLNYNGFVGKVHPPSSSGNATVDVNSPPSLGRNALINPLQLRNVYISGLPSHYRSNDFRALCQRFGRVEASKLCVDGSTTPTKGYGFALFYTDESAAACIQGLNNALLCGRCLQARYADPGATPRASDGAFNRRLPLRAPTPDEAGAGRPVEGMTWGGEGVDQPQPLPPPPFPPGAGAGGGGGFAMGGLNNVAVRVPNTPMMVAAAPGSLGQDVLPLSLATLTAKPLYGVPMPMAMPVPVPYAFVSVPQGMPAQRYYITS